MVGSGDGTPGIARARRAHVWACRVPDACSPDACSPDACSPETCSPETCASATHALSWSENPSRSGVTTAVVSIDQPLDRADVPRLCARLHELLAGRGEETTLCAVDVYAEPDLVTVEALAQLQLTARRLGARIRLRHTSCRLHQLLALTGLDAVVGTVRS